MALVTTHSSHALSELVEGGPETATFWFTDTARNLPSRLLRYDQVTPANCIAVEGKEEEDTTEENESRISSPCSMILQIMVSVLQSFRKRKSSIANRNKFTDSSKIFN